MDNINTAQLATGVVLVLLGAFFLTRSKKPWLVVVGGLLTVVGSWFLLALFDFGVDNNTGIFLACIVLIVVGVQLVRAEGTPATITGVVSILVGVFAISQTPPVNELALGGYFGDALSYAGDVWDKLFSRASDAT